MISHRQAIRVLYISYDGVLEPLGQSQILPYLQGLGALCAKFTLLSFEKPAAWKRPEQMASFRATLAQRGILWVPFRYHKRPTLIATAWDMLVGTVCAWQIVRRQKIQVVHARSYVAALIGWILKRTCGVKFIFDMRGFWADERVEGGLWSAHSIIYRLAKRLERQLLQAADHVITLTERARRTIEDWYERRYPLVTVIPTCVDLERFSAEPVPAAGRGGPFFLYAGSVGTWYLLPEMLTFVAQARDRFRDAKMIVATRQVPEALRALQASGLSAPVVEVASRDPIEIPGIMAQAHAGMAFYKPGFSRQGTCPTKIGEYLAAGLPVIVNRGIGDTEQIVRAAKAGVVIDEFSREAFDRALDELEQLWADPGLPARCRQLAATSFSLALGLERYRTVYRQVVIAA